MSCSLWAYTAECDGRPCPGDCDVCEQAEKNMEEDDDG